MGCLWCGKIQQAMQDDAIRTARIHPAVHPGNRRGMKCSYGKISSLLTEISGTEPARLLIWTHRKFYKGFKGEARSRKPGQPRQPGSYEEALGLWSAPRRKVERPTLPNPFFAKNSCLDRESITVSTSSRALDQFCHILITMSASNWVLWNRILTC